VKPFGVSLVLALVAASVWIASVVSGDRGAWFAYLAAFSWCASSVLGGLCLLMIGHTTGARWLVTMRRLSEAVAGCVPLLALLFLPIAFALGRLYPWARPLAELEDSTREVVAHSQSWYTPRLFLLRSAVYLLVWIALGESLRRLSLAQDRAVHGSSEGRQTSLSAPGLVAVIFTGSFAAFDWVMSAVPGWNFNVLGLFLLTGGFAAAVGAQTIALWLALRARVIVPEHAGAHAHALGRVLLTAVCLWSYLAACQLIIVWSADLPPESRFYLLRTQGTFRALAVLLAFGHFILPLLALLSRNSKRRPELLAIVGGWLVLMHAVDVYWLIFPAAPRAPQLADGAPFVLVFALSASVAWLRFKRAPALPLGSPELGRSLRYEAS